MEVVLVTLRPELQVERYEVQLYEADTYKSHFLGKKSRIYLGRLCTPVQHDGVSAEGVGRVGGQARQEPRAGNPGRCDKGPRAGAGAESGRGEGRCRSGKPGNKQTE